MREPLILRARLGIDCLLRGSEAKNGRAGKGAENLEGLASFRENERESSNDVIQRLQAQWSGGSGKGS